MCSRGLVPISLSYLMFIASLVGVGLVVIYVHIHQRVHSSPLVHFEGNQLMPCLMRTLPLVKQAPSINVHSQLTSILFMISQIASCASSPHWTSWHHSIDLPCRSAHSPNILLYVIARSFPTDSSPWSPSTNSPHSSIVLCTVLSLVWVSWMMIFTCLVLLLVYLAGRCPLIKCLFCPSSIACWLGGIGGGIWVRSLCVSCLQPVASSSDCP